jgi:hypothetical protein
MAPRRNGDDPLTGQRPTDLEVLNSYRYEPLHG